jgi:hypothetical protein
VSRVWVKQRRVCKELFKQVCDNPLAIVFPSSSIIQCPAAYALAVTFLLAWTRNRRVDSGVTGAARALALAAASGPRSLAGPDYMGWLRDWTRTLTASGSRTGLYEFGFIEVGTVTPLWAQAGRPRAAHVSWQEISA